MLQTIREYARGKLEESGELEPMLDRLTGYVTALTETSETALYGPKQEKAMDRLDREGQNIAFVLDLLLSKGDSEKGLHLAGSLGYYWQLRFDVEFGGKWLEGFLALPEHGQQGSTRAKALFSLGRIRCQAIGTQWGDLFQRSLALYRAAEDVGGIALSLSWIGYHGWHSVGSEIPRDTPPESCLTLDQSVELARDSGNPWIIAFCLGRAYALPRADRDLALAKTGVEEAIVLARSVGDPCLTAWELHDMGFMLETRGRLEESLPWYEEALSLVRRMPKSDYWVVAYGFLTGRMYALCEKTGEGCRLLQEVLQQTEDYTRAPSWFGCVWEIGRVAILEGNNRRGVRIISAVVAWNDERKNLPPETNVNPHPYVAGIAGLDDAALREEWAAGRAMGMERALQDALAYPS